MIDAQVKLMFIEAFGLIVLSIIDIESYFGSFKRKFKLLIHLNY